MNKKMFSFLIPVLFCAACAQEKTEIPQDLPDGPSGAGTLLRMKSDRAQGLGSDDTLTFYVKARSGEESVIHVDPAEQVVLKDLAPGENRIYGILGGTDNVVVSMYEEYIALERKGELTDLQGGCVDVAGNEKLPVEMSVRRLVGGLVLNIANRAELGDDAEVAVRILEPRCVFLGDAGNLSSIMDERECRSDGSLQYCFPTGRLSGSIVVRLGSGETRELEFFAKNSIVANQKLVLNLTVNLFLKTRSGAGTVVCAEQMMDL